MKAIILHSIYQPVFEYNQMVKDFAEFLDLDSDQVATITIDDYNGTLLLYSIPQFFWQTCNQKTRLVVLKWMPENFNFELMLNAVTKGITVERKAKMDFKISPRFLFLTEYNPGLVGESTKRRFLKINCSPNPL